MAVGVYHPHVTPQSYDELFTTRILYNHHSTYPHGDPFLGLSTSGRPIKPVRNQYDRILEEGIESYRRITLPGLRWYPYPHAGFQ